MKVIANPKYSQYLSAWAAKRIGNTFPPDAQALGVFRDDKLAAVAVFTDYMKTAAGGNIMIHFAAETPRWATKEAIRFFLAYPFKQLGCNRVTATIAKTNRRSRKLVYGIGFRLEGKLRNAAPNGKDMMIYGLLKTEFETGRFGERHGKEQQRATAA